MVKKLGLPFPFKKLEKEQQIKPKVNRKKKGNIKDWSANKINRKQKINRENQ